MERSQPDSVAGNGIALPRVGTGADASAFSTLESTKHDKLSSATSPADPIGKDWTTFQSIGPHSDANTKTYDSSDDLGTQWQLPKTLVEDAAPTSSQQQGKISAPDMNALQTSRIECLERRLERLVQDHRSECRILSDDIFEAEMKQRRLFSTVEGLTSEVIRLKGRLEWIERKQHASILSRDSSTVSEVYLEGSDASETQRSAEFSTSSTILNAEWKHNPNWKAGPGAGSSTCDGPSEGTTRSRLRMPRQQAQEPVDLDLATSPTRDWPSSPDAWASSTYNSNPMHDARRMARAVSPPLVSPRVSEHQHRRRGWKPPVRGRKQDWLTADPEAGWDTELLTRPQKQQRSLASCFRYKGKAPMHAEEVTSSHNKAKNAESRQIRW